MNNRMFNSDCSARRRNYSIHRLVSLSLARALWLLLIITQDEEEEQQQQEEKEINNTMLF